MSEQAPINTQGNVPEFSVAELAFSLKRTLEDTYGHVRVRGELAGVKVAASGHLYADIKDEDANINIVCWRGTMGRLSVKPEEGLEVIITGKVSSYPKSSRYQIIVESMEMAGEGALLKMLEERKKKLAAEGLFDPARKQKLPFLPRTIGVVTSPTGAVIRDIMHRLRDRFPSHVLLWPVLVQGDGAADQIAGAVRGFDALELPYRPDILIVARGGGSLEDLMAFNEESVVRAVADCTIPVISAVGHETDTTLIDFAADLRAPTPTGAAEMAVPVRAELMARILENQQRIIGGASRLVGERRHQLAAQAARLGDPGRLLEIKNQALDHSSHKLTGAFEKGVSGKQSRMAELAAQLRHPRTLIEEKTRMLSYHAQALVRQAPVLFRDGENRLQSAGRMLESLSFKSVLERGFVVVRDDRGVPVTAADQTRTGQNIQLQFRDDKRVDAVVGKGHKDKSVPPAPQGQLF
ncbi:MAG: exodeoxyribonuclease VII large subunit [Rhodospirillales bacterium]|nr:exodeoxyribonuclease VII large subunit [Rhodospirillales bacterium]